MTGGAASDNDAGGESGMVMNVGESHGEAVNPDIDVGIGGVGTHGEGGGAIKTG